MVTKLFSEYRFFHWELYCSSLYCSLLSGSCLLICVLYIYFGRYRTGTIIINPTPISSIRPAVSATFSPLFWSTVVLNPLQWPRKPRNDLYMLEECINFFFVCLFPHFVRRIKQGASKAAKVYYVTFCELQKPIFPRVCHTQSEHFLD